MQLNASKLFNPSGKTTMWLYICYLHFSRSNFHNLPKLNHTLTVTQHESLTYICHYQVVPLGHYHVTNTMIGHNFFGSSNDKRAPDRRSFDWLGRRYRACPSPPPLTSPRANRNKVLARIECERKGSGFFKLYGYIDLKKYNFQLTLKFNWQIILISLK